MIGRNSLIHASLGYRIGLDIIPLDTIPNTLKNFVRSFLEELELSYDVVEKTTRLGKKTGTSQEKDTPLTEHHRPLMVTLNNSSESETVMKNLRKLKNAPDELRNLRISPDRSRKEREEVRNLIQRAKNLIEQETGDFMHIVRGTTIIKVKRERYETRKEMNLNIMFTNADTLTKDKMLELLQTIYNRSTLPHVIAISEAKPKYSKTDFNPVTVQIPSYNMEPRNMKLTDKGRGMLLFLTDDLDYRPIDTSSKTDEFLYVSIKLQLETLFLESVYRSPNSSTEINIMINNFIRQESQRSNFPMIGDLNLPKRDWESNTSNTVVGSKENNFLDALADSYLTQHINRPTRIRGDDKPSLVDLVVSDTSTPAEEIEHLPPLGDSDHALLQMKVSFVVVSYVKKRLNFRKANFDAMRSFLRGTTVPDELDVNEKWLFLKSKITEAVIKFIPELSIKSNKNRRYTANRDILELVRKKKRLWKNFVDSKSPDDHKKYKASRNLLRKETRNLAQEMEQEKTNNLKSNPKKHSSYVSQKTKRRKTIPAIRREDGSFTQTDLEKAEELSLFFKPVFVNEGPGLWQINTTHKCMEDNITFTEKEVLEEINAHNTAKSAGVDNISPRILKVIGSEIAPLLSQIMTESWNTAILQVAGLYSADFQISE